MIPLEGMGDGEIRIAMTGQVNGDGTWLMCEVQEQMKLAKKGKLLMPGEMPGESQARRRALKGLRGASPAKGVRGR
jgi:hypothetical protein